MVISKIVIEDSRGYVFTVDNNTIDSSEDNSTIIQKALSEIANTDKPELYKLERKKGMIYVRFIGKST